MNNNFRIYATNKGEFEKILLANFLDDDELKIVKRIATRMFDKRDADMHFWESMTETEKHNYELNKGTSQLYFVALPIFVFDNSIHRHLICYIELAGIGMQLSIEEIPDLFDRYDVINLLR